MRGPTLVLVTHDPEIANRADRKIVLKDGMIIEDIAAVSRTLMKSEVMAQSRDRWLSEHWMEASGGDCVARSEIGAGEVCVCGADRWRWAWRRWWACADSARAFGRR